MNSFFGWVGGKMALRDVIVDRFPVSFDRYIEVFGGAAWVLFHKQPGRFEVYNDANKNLVTLFRCVRERPEELKEALRYVLNARTDFQRILALFREDADMDDIQRAANYYQLIRYSYASSCDSYGCQPHDIWNDFPQIDAAHKRLRDVLIENKDYAALIKQYDRPDSLCYCDPPYFGTESMYEGVNFNKDSHIRLRDTLLGIDGYFLLSYNACDFISELYDRPGIYIQEVSRLNNIKQRYDGGSEYAELLIANYDMDERSLLQPRQMNLFQTDTAGEVTPYGI